MNETEEKTKEHEELEECEWCNTTGDIKRTNRIYWGTILFVVILLVILYILAVKF